VHVYVRGIWLQIWLSVQPYLTCHHPTIRSIAQAAVAQIVQSRPDFLLGLDENMRRQTEAVAHYLQTNAECRKYAHTPRSRLMSVRLLTLMCVLGCGSWCGGNEGSSTSTLSGCCSTRRPHPSSAQRPSFIGTHGRRVSV
jgi:hypothetical protein